MIPVHTDRILRRTRIVERKGELLAVFRNRSGKFDALNRAELMHRMKETFEHNEFSPHEAYALFSLDQAEKGREKILHIH